MACAMQLERGLCAAGPFPLRQPRLAHDKEDRMTISAGRWIMAATTVAAFLGGARLVAQAQAPPGQPTPTVKTKPASGFVPIEGKDSFAGYCAACHGATGKGNGPAAPALKMPVPDLTTLAQRNGGTFNAMGIERQITGIDKATPAHGDLTMPIWGPIFKSTGGDQTAALRAKNLVDYLKSIQVK
jgi:mono/diheme cytochrome c family protein